MWNERICPTSASIRGQFEKNTSKAKTAVHTPEVVGSNPAPATNAPVAQSVEQWIEDPCVVGSIPTGGTMNDNKLTFLGKWVFLLHTKSSLQSNSF